MPGKSKVKQQMEIAYCSLDKPKFSDMVLTSADGQSVYAKCLSFVEDLATVETALNLYDRHFRGEAAAGMTTGSFSGSAANVVLLNQSEEEEKKTDMKGQQADQQQNKKTEY